MQRIPEKAGGWQSVKGWIRTAAKRINALGNIQITRSGSTDTVNVSDNGILINVRNIQGGGRGGGSGFSIRQLTGGIIPDGEEPSTAEYQSAITTLYSNQSLEPQYGDLISLRVSGGSRLVARFWILEDDQAATNATISFDFSIGDPPESVTFYALNVTYTPLEQMIDAIQDYLAGPNGGQDPDGRDIEPDGTAPFAISVNGNYSTDTGGFLVPSSNATVEVNGGSVQVTDDISATAGGISSSFSFPGSDGVSYVHLYLKVTITLGGPNGTPSSASATIESRTTTSAGVPAVSETSFPTASTAEKSYTIGVVALARRGDRRYARITQSFAGDLKAYSNGTGSSNVDSNGVNTAAGLREVTLCVNGKPYITSILTGPLTEVT